jgi:hypothetical protein
MPKASSSAPSGDNIDATAALVLLSEIEANPFTFGGTCGFLITSNQQNRLRQLFTAAGGSDVSKPGISPDQLTAIRTRRSELLSDLDEVTLQARLLRGEEASANNLRLGSIKSDIAKLDRLLRQL